MSEQGNVEAPPQVDPQVEREARNLGWVPQERFRGDPEKWVPAEEFVRRGHEVMPILRKNNEKLLSEVLALRSALGDSQKAIEDLKTFQGEFVKSRLAEQRARLTAELKVAKEAGDTSREVEIIDELTEVKAAEKAAPKVVEKANGADQPPPPDPSFLAWKEANPWFGQDKRKTALALGIAQELTESNVGLRGEAFFDRVSEEIEATLGQPRPKASKSEGGGPPSGQAKGGGGGFSGLPAEAQAQARADAKRFVGPNKAFKTEKEWFDHYTRLYNES